nr:ATP-binding protein [Agrilactobacillus composti]
MQDKKTETKVRLSTKEKGELILDGILTFFILIILELALLLSANQFFAQGQDVRANVQVFRQIFTLDFPKIGQWHLNIWMCLGIILINAWIVYRRLMRRFQAIQMHHVIQELHYIADNHFDHRITFKVNPDLQKVVTSINALVESTSRSISEERRIEQSKDELITNVSHDIRTPLTSVIGYLGLIENGQYQNRAELLKYTHTAFVKSKQMKLLVDDLFEFTKIQQTATTMNFTQVNMTNMIAQLAASYELEAQKQNIHIVTKTRPDPLMMAADPEKLSRVYNNLIINALKYGKGATELIIEGRQYQDEAIIAIRNNGQKIPDNDILHLFDRFYRVEGSRSHETGGSGLGLAIAQSIVALHGGFIYASSTDEQTSFIMHLPLKGGARLQQPDNIEAQDAQLLRST